ncbi:hypothetical protein BH10PLA1_BH10PLA1_06860 [soil metagenome]
MSIRDVLLLSTDSKTVTLVAAALSSNGQLSNNNVYRDLESLVVRLEQGGIPAVLLDIDTQSEKLLQVIEPVIRRFSDTKFVALSGTMRNDLLLEAMQVGVRQFLVKDSIAADLSNILHRLCPESAGTIQGGAVTVLSAGGGTGATTIAVNLAAELQPAEPGPTLVVDLDPAYGAVGTYLSLDGEYGAFDLFRRDDTIDAQLIQSTALAASNNMHALLSTARRRLGDVVPFDAHKIGRAVEACRRAYRWTVIDAPRVPLDCAAELVKKSNATLLLMQLTIKDIQVARQMITGLGERGLASNRVMVVATRYHKRRLAISLDEARKALGLNDSQQLHTLANDYDAVTAAVNLGKPLAQAAPRSDIRRDLQKLAGTLAAMPAPVSMARGLASLLNV